MGLCRGINILTWYIEPNGIENKDLCQKMHTIFVSKKTILG